MQLLAFTAMDPPSSMRGEDLQRERLKLLRSVIPVTPGEAVLGQYEGYRDEDGVTSRSRTDTYAALRVEIDSWRWAGVPFYLRTGKRMAARSAEVVVVFKPAPHSPFGAAAARPSPNRLVIGIQPGERVALQMSGKRPGDGLDIVDVDLEFDAGASHDTDAPEAYERLLGDAFAGDRTLFTSGAEVEAQWAVIAPLLDTRPTPVALRAGQRRARTPRPTCRPATAAAGARWSTRSEPVLDQPAGDGQPRRELQRRRPRRRACPTARRRPRRPRARSRRG